MIEFFSWLKEAGERTETPWCVLGKGPTFAKRKDFPHLGRDYQTLGLNHVCREYFTFLTHIIDLDVIREVPQLPDRTLFLLMPWHPHVNFKARELTLDKCIEENPVLEFMDKSGRLLWYNLSTWHDHPRPGSPVVSVAFYSAEAAIRILAMGGIRKIRTLGVDGGDTYSEDFKDIKPFRGGHNTFDLQWKYIRQTVKDFALDFGPLA